LPKLMRGGLFYLLLSACAWLGVTLLFYLPSVRKSLIRIGIASPLMVLKLQRSPAFKAVLTFCREHSIAAIACDADTVYCYDFVDQAACLEEFLVDYGTGTEQLRPMPSPYVKAFHMNDHGLNSMGQPEIAAFAAALAFRLRGYRVVMHILSAEDYDEAVSVSGGVNVNTREYGRVRIGGTVRRHTCRREQLLDCYYYVAPRA